MLLLHPIPRAHWVIIRPSGVLMLPLGLDLRSTALGQHQNSLGADNTHEPSGWGVIISQYLIILSLFTILSQVIPILSFYILPMYTNGKKEFGGYIISGHAIALITSIYLT